MLKIVLPFTPIRRPIHVSVIVPSYNQGRYIEETILSVLRQDYEYIELLVVDGASTDNTLDVLRKYSRDPRVRWLSEPDNGPNSAFNKGLRLAQGDLCGFQTSSDTYLQGAIREAVKEFQADPSLTLFGGSVQVVDTKGYATGELWLLPERFHFTIEDVVSFRNYPGVQATFFRRDLALAVGGVDERLQSCHTIFFLQYLLESLRLGGRALGVPTIWGTFRQHLNHRNRLPAVKGLPYCRERHEACRLNAERYGEFLSREQIKLLRRSAYLFEIQRRVISYKQVVRTLPAVIAALWFGARLADFAPLIREFSAKVRARLTGKCQPPVPPGKDMRWFLRVPDGHVPSDLLT